MPIDPRRQLVGLSLSPFTDRARWALDWCGIDYEYKEHLLFFGIPALRWRIGQLTGEVSVPVLFTEDLPRTDSYDIARYADQTAGAARGKRGGLFPPEHIREIAAINQMSEDAMDAGRALVVMKTLKDPQAQSASLPSFIPKAARGICRPLARFGLNYIARSYQYDESRTQSERVRLSDILKNYREKLKTSPRYLLGTFTYADIVAAISLQFVRPVDARFKRLPKNVIPCWTDESLAKEFADLLEWRDSIYAAHHPRAETVSKERISENPDHRR